MYSILYTEHNLTRFNHQKNATHLLSSRQGPSLLSDRAEAGVRVTLESFRWTPPPCHSGIIGI